MLVLTAGFPTASLGRRSPYTGIHRSDKKIVELVFSNTPSTCGGTVYFNYLAANFFTDKILTFQRSDIRLA